ncbi:hypothetical protein [Affinibrenneria salicis]|uniref:hypothetical protein n=1 Tax=Affinibrenneria salicis TaxID=2590031 RepID=UPI00168B13FA|nr:hypothetical protein [Affinibrenneria salicis]
MGKPGGNYRQESGDDGALGAPDAPRRQDIAGLTRAWLADALALETAMRTTATAATAVPAAMTTARAAEWREQATA